MSKPVLVCWEWNWSTCFLIFRNCNCGRNVKGFRVPALTHICLQFRNCNDDRNRNLKFCFRNRIWYLVYDYIILYICVCSWLLIVSCCFDVAPEVVEKPGDTSLSRLKMLYTQAKDLSDNEAKYVCSVALKHFIFFYTVSNDQQLVSNIRVSYPYIILNLVAAFPTNW